MPRFLQPDYGDNNQDATIYAVAQDVAVLLHHPVAGAFYVQPQAPASLSVDVLGGIVPFNDGTRLEVSPQTVGPITVPTADPRNDIVFLNTVTGVVGIRTGTPAGSPTDPLLTINEMALARIVATSSMIEVGDAELVDLRGPTSPGGAGEWEEITDSPFLFTGSDTGNDLANIFADGRKSYKIELNSLQPTVSAVLYITAFIDQSELTGINYYYNVPNETQNSFFNFRTVSNGVTEGLSGQIFVDDPGVPNQTFKTLRGFLTQRLGAVGARAVYSWSGLVRHTGLLLSTGVLTGLKFEWQGGGVAKAGSEIRVYRK